MNRAAAAVDGLAQDVSPWVRRLARFGYIAKGIVYMLVGVLAVRAALGPAQATGSRGALRAVAHAPLGTVLLAAIAIGLFGYALWRAYTAIADPEHDGGMHRIYAAGVAVLHASIGAAAARLALSGRGGGDGGTQHWTATALAQPLGRWIVAGIAAAIIIAGSAQLVRAWKARLDDQLDLHKLRPRSRAWVKGTARFGIAARGVVFLLVGFYLGRAALRFDPGEARDPGGALRALEHDGTGVWVLGVVAAGLFAYGVYELIRARYRRIHVGRGRPGIRLERA